MSARRRWPDLPPELLAVVSGRLHNAADYVRFHAVCKTWRESLPASASLRPSFFPWLVAQSSRRPLDMKLRCVFSKTSYRAVVPARFSRRIWVARADGMAGWFFCASPVPTLFDPFTGAATALPPFVRGDGKTEWEMENSGGIMYGDGTIFVYNFLHNSELCDWELDVESEQEVLVATGFPHFRAAILRPGDTGWKFVNRWFDMKMEEDTFLRYQFLAAYRVYNGKTLVRMDLHRDNWYLLPPPVRDHASGGSQGMCEMAWRIPERDVITNSYLWSSHVLESRGKLLRVSVWIRRRQPVDDEVSALDFLMVSVHQLEEEVEAGGKQTVCWVRKDSGSFADLVMFLGFPTSFSMEASRFRGGEDDVSGGWVYFLQRRSQVYGQPLSGVVRYSLIDGKTEFVERLPLDLIDDRKSKVFMWLMPQPVITPIQVIRERLESPMTCGQTLKISITRMEKPSKHSKEHFLSFNVRNLRPSVDSSWVSSFFNQYGEVSKAEVNSVGKGCVTMAMETSYETYEVADALDGLLLNGYTMKISEATKEFCVVSSRGEVTTT